MRIIWFFVCVLVGLLLLPIVKTVLDELDPTVAALPNISPTELTITRLLPLALLAVIFIYALFALITGGRDDRR